MIDHSDYHCLSLLQNFTPSFHDATVNRFVIMVGWLISIALFVLFNFCCAQDRRTINPLELRTTKGEFFIYTLHSGNFFPQASNNLIVFVLLFLSCWKTMACRLEFDTISSIGYCHGNILSFSLLYFMCTTNKLMENCGIWCNRK